MKDYLSLAACKGVCPVRQFPAFHHRTRLINRLLQRRDTLRVLAAPAGFGKTTLVASYVETMFNFDHVFWLDGESPCFLRDLDDGSMAARLIEVDPSVRCVVVDDMPRLDVARRAAFASVVAALQQAGAEVLVCTDVVAAQELAGEMTCSVMDAAKLLLDDAEWEERVGATGELIAAGSAIARIPGVAWGESTGYKLQEAVVAHLAAQELPLQELLVLEGMLLCGEGPVELLTEAYGEQVPLAEAELREIARTYPYVALDNEGTAFAALNLEAAAVARALHARHDELAGEAGVPKSNASYAALADALVALGKGERAAEVAGCLSQSGLRATWLATHQTELLQQGALCEASQLFGGVGTGLGKCKEATALRLGQALRLRILGYQAATAAELGGLGAGSSVSPTERLLARLIGLAPDEETSPEALLALAEAVKEVESEVGGTSPLVKLAKTVLLRPTASVEAFSAALSFAGAWQEEAKATGAGGRTGDASFDDPITCLLLAQLKLARDAAAFGLTALSAYRRGLFALRDTALRVLSRGADAVLTVGHGLTLSAFLAVQILEELARVGLPKTELPSAVSAAYRQSAKVLVTQQTKARHIFGKTGPKMGGSPMPQISQPKFVVTTPGTATAAPVPLLQVKLLGALEVRIGDTLIDASEFSRQKVKVLMALLTLNAGTELTRERITQQLWPSSYTDVASRSFYSVWSKLRRVLTNEEGECPYITRLQQGFRMEGAYMKSDVARLQELCRVFLLGRVDALRWLELLEEFEELYRGELLPSEFDSPLICAAREQLHRRAVDALISAVLRLLAEGEERIALLFAYAAFQRETNREDVYYTLMKAQLACEQRTSAIDTYLTCKDMLAEGLGIDPSKKLMDLYLSIINDDSGLRVAAM